MNNLTTYNFTVSFITTFLLMSLLCCNIADVSHVFCDVGCEFVDSNDTNDFKSDKEDNTMEEDADDQKFTNAHPLKFLIYQKGGLNNKFAYLDSKHFLEIPTPPPDTHLSKS